MVDTAVHGQLDSDMFPSYALFRGMALFREGANACIGM